MSESQAIRQNTRTRTGEYAKYGPGELAGETPYDVLNDNNPSDDILTLLNDPPATSSVAWQGYEDDFTDTEINLILSGRLDDVRRQVHARHHQAAVNAVEMDAQAWVNTAHDQGTFTRTWDQLTEDEKQGLRETLWDMGDFTPVEHMFHNTQAAPILIPATPKRPYDLVTPEVAMTGRGPDGKLPGPVFDARVAALRKTITDAGIKDQDGWAALYNSDKIKYLVSNGPDQWDETVRMDIVTHTRVQEVMPETGTKAMTYITVTDPLIQIADPRNGQHIAAGLIGKFTRSYNPAALRDAPSNQQPVLADERPGRTWPEGLVTAMPTPIRRDIIQD